jgi:Lhr-like helicase
VLLEALVQVGQYLGLETIGRFRLKRRQNNQMMSARNIIRKAATNAGMIIDRMETAVATRSSAMLTGTLAVPPVVAVTAGRTAAALTT